ncbi:MAG TPA: GNAT family N-acetyltransferase [Candidatus Acidoferrales bacterium]|nr:GNAT family N-acetyltransferase [Candidatus Acidoferrales bacterium]
MAKAAAGDGLEIRPLTPAHVDDVKKITASTFGSQCWDLWWRYTKAEWKGAAISGGTKDENSRRRREILQKLARRRHAPVLVAYEGDEPMGFVSLGPRADYKELNRGKTTQPVDDVPAWVIPCITVRKTYRGRGIALALLRAAIEYAAKHGAPAVDGYPRPDERRFSDGAVFMGTESLFRRAGFRKIRGVLGTPPWAPRLTMRASCVPTKKR